MMDKKHALKDISAAELRQELVARLREQIQRNEVENERLREQIRQLNPQVVVMSTGSRPRGRPATRLVRNGMSLREAIVQVLKDATEPLRVKEVVERVKQAGYESKAGNFPAMVSISLSQNDELFEKISRGVYRLRIGALIEAEQTNEPEIQVEPAIMMAQ